MAIGIALFRGINVGGKNVLPMADLVEIVTALGLERVRTYIQSGNVVFESEKAPRADLAARIADAIEADRGFRPQVLVFGADRLADVIAANPFPEAEAEPQSLHAFFLASAPDSPDIAALEKARADTERFRLDGATFFLHAPDGIGRSRLAAKVEGALGVTATARNWRTVLALWELTEPGMSARG